MTDFLFLLVASWALQALVCVWLVDHRDGRAVMSLIGFIAALVAYAVVNFN